MLRAVNDLIGDKILARDGEIGEVYSLYFDDQTWTVRYLVVDTGNWLEGRTVLISPASVAQPHWEQDELPVNLTRKQVESSPDVGSEMPVSRQNEATIVNYFGWPTWWSGFNAPLRPPAPETPLGDLPAVEGDPEAVFEQQEENDPHLRDVREVIDYGVRAQDGEIGRLAGFIVDDETWTLRYAVVDTGNWLPGRKVLVATSWIAGINWEDSSADVNLTRQLIETSPEYDPDRAIDREYEQQLHEHYARQTYWR